MIKDEKNRKSKKMRPLACAELQLQNR